MREQILKEIARAVKCSCSSLNNLDSSGLATEATLSIVEAYMLKEVWTTIPGNSVAYTYYSAIVPGDNPSGSANLETAAYSDGGGVVYTQTFTYDINDNVISIVVS